VQRKLDKQTNDTGSDSNSILAEISLRNKNQESQQNPVALPQLKQLNKPSEMKHTESQESIVKITGRESVSPTTRSDAAQNNQQPRNNAVYQSHAHP
jgi:hypothetical protein